MNQPTTTLPLLKPHPLQPGQTIGIVSTSGAFNNRQTMWPQMERTLTERGYQVSLAPHAQAAQGYLAGSDEDRATDLMAFWQDPTIDAIWCSQGGYGSMRLLDRLDYNWICQHPKPIIGFSDASALLLALHRQTGLVGFHGPMAVSNFGYPQTHPFTDTHCWTMLEGRFNVPYDLPNALADHYQCLRPGPTITGPLIVANLQLLTALLGTPYLPNLSRAVLMIEDVVSPIFIVDRMLTQLKLAGVFEQIAGLIIGEMVALQTDPHPLVPLAMDGAPTPLALAQALASELSIPVGYGFSCGHSPAQTTLPLGITIAFESTTGQVTLLDSPFANIP